MNLEIVDEQGNTAYGGVHNHVKEEFQAITVTDICTIMLNQHLTHWKYYVRVSQKYLSFWDCEKNELRIVSNSEENMNKLEKMIKGSKNNK